MIPRTSWQETRARVEPWIARLVHQYQLVRVRLERLAGRLLGRGSRPRIVATACWDFPIYSQTFVYQELTQLITHGFNLRFLYAHLTSRDRLPSQFSPLWHDRRRVILHPSVGQRAYAYYAARQPEKVAALVDLLSRTAGLSPEEIRGHHHFPQAFAFTRMVEAARPDYLHSYFFYEGTLFSLVASYMLDIPRGVSCYADHMLDDYALKLVPRHLEQCALVIATSARIKRELMLIAPHADPDRILVKPNAINAAAFPVVEPKDPAGEQPYRLVCLSRIEPKKGIIYLVDAVGVLRDRGVRVELHLIGGVDESDSSRDYAREVTARLMHLRLGDIVHLEGRQPESEIKRFFARSHLFVAPFVETESGDKDGIPTSLLEGMASGLPVVATDAGSMPEVIDNGQDGVLVSQRDVAALSHAIETLLRDPARRRRLGRAAAAKVRGHFDVGVCEASFHERVRALISAHHPRAR